MKKFIVIALAALFFCSCQKEGQYSPNKKIAQIQNIYASESGYSTYSQSEIWHWDGRQLTAIDTYHDSALMETLLFTYGSNKRLTKAVLTYKYATDTPDTYTFDYNGSQLTSIDMNNGEATYSITHQDDHISMLEIEYTRNTGYNHKALAWLLPREVAEAIAAGCQQHDTRTAKGGDSKEMAKKTIAMEWRKDNIVQIKIYGDDYSASYDLNYDKKRNPYYQSTADATILFDANTPPSRNNVLSVQAVEYRGNVKTSEYTLNYSYQYNGKYPVSVLRTTSSGTCTTYYEYL
ncbi:MAG: hypothetical protein IJU81_06860 [Bacteroidales bacterium]|nr:hypothetical protein [Bacteroidales bacterium]